MTRRREPDPQRLLAAHGAASELYRARIQAEPRALAYLHSRGIVAATAHTPPWTLGYAPGGWTQLRDHLREAGYHDDELLAAGLVTTARNGNVIDVFRDRVMFPIRNPDGDVVAFTGRDLSGHANTPKYKNTTTTAIYRKSELLYGLAEQVGGDTQPAAVMVVEGSADVIAVARLRESLGGEEYRQPYAAVAPCGTALTADQVARLADAVPPGTPLVVCFDPDTAGRVAAERAYKLVRDWPGPLDAIALPAGADPAELVAQGRASAVQTLQRLRGPLVDRLVDLRIGRYRLDEIPGRLAALHAAAPLVADVAARDIGHAARLSAHLVTRLDLLPLTVYEAIYPPAEDAEYPDALPSTAETKPADPPNRPATPMGGAGFPDPTHVGHQHARACPPTAPAATWVQHDPRTGHTAWVLAEGATDTPGDRDAARIAAETAGRAALIVGAHHAVDLARLAVNVHFTQPGTGRGDAAITVLTSFDGDRPTPGWRPFTVAWAGDIRAFGSTGSWFAPLTTPHHQRQHNLEADRGDDRRQQALWLLTRRAGTADAVPKHHRDALAQATDAGWLTQADLLDLAAVWHHTTSQQIPNADATAARQAVEQQLRRIYPQPMALFDDAIASGQPPAEAMYRAAQQIARVPARAGDGALTASVRGGPIGVNRIDIALVQIALIGRGLAHTDPDTVRRAIEWRQPDSAAQRLTTLGRAVSALVVRPEGPPTAAQLAQQDQAAIAAPRRLPPLPTRVSRRALPAPAPRRPGR
jgi:DNA primase catalytic core